MLLNLFEFFCCLVVDCQSMQSYRGPSIGSLV